MSGYTRQSSSDLVPTAVVRSSPLNAEYNKIRDAFAFDATGTTGHKHDGSSDEGSYVPLIADLDALNKVAIDTGNNRVGFFVEVSSTAVEQARLSDGLFAPVTTNDVDLGAVAAKFKDLHLAGDANVGGDVNVTGSLVGNVTGNITGNITGNVTGDLTGNVTAASGSSSFTNVTINGTLDVTNTPITNVSDPTSAQEAATKAYVDTADNLKLNLSGGTMSGAIAMGTSKITGLGDPTLAQDAATKAYVDSEVSSLVASAPGALDTLNELAAAIGDDANFSTTITNSIATKLPLAGGTMSGAIEMGTSKITGLGDPTLAQDAVTKTYTDTADNLKLNLSGGTMSGAIAMGNSKITGLGTPTTGTDATTKTYVDGILGSATAAADSAAAALVSENNAAASYDAFDDRYLGSKASDPSVDNDGDALLTGAIYWNTTSSTLRVYDGATWNLGVFDTSGALVAANNLSDLTNAATARTNLGLGTDDLPAISPTLNLDFANAQSITSKTTYTRASTATYYDANGTLQTASVDAPRFDHDPVTGERLGILLEEQRTNLLTYSEQFDDASWLKSGATVTANTTTAPDGTTTADKLVEDTSTGTHSVGKSVTITSGSSVVYSIYAKASGRDVLQINAANGGNLLFARFDLSNGSIFQAATVSSGADISNGVATIVDAGGGYYRCILVVDTSTITSVIFTSYLHNRSSSSYTGDGTSGIYVWGAQLEVGSFPTSYIKTEASQVTRSADNLSITGTNFSDFYNQSEGTFVCEWGIKDVDGTSDTSHQIFGLTDGGSPPIIAARMGYSAGRRLRYYAQDAGSTFEYGLNGVVTAATEGRFALAYSPSSSFRASEDGATVVEDNTGSIADFTISQISIGLNTSSYLNGHIKSLTYYPRALTNAQLQSLTTA